ncbi:MAG: hypothetical protein KKA73_18240 [Chloroflexi bacterium]|nr:hypothetical protein [Chloroflexota bacterium]
MVGAMVRPAQAPKPPIKRLWRLETGWSYSPLLARSPAKPWAWLPAVRSLGGYTATTPEKGARMLEELFSLYQDGLINQGHPKCLFAETLIFNEGWLLRSVLKEWQAHPPGSRLAFLPFPAGARVYSEGQLYTPFKARFRGDKRAESHTHVDGVVGDFSIADTKSGIVLDPAFRYIAVLEAKMHSPLARGTTNAPDFDQLSRTAACLIHAIIQTGTRADYRAHLAVIYAQANRRVDPAQYSKTHIESQIDKRLQAYVGTDQPDEASAPFITGWRDVLNRLQVWFLTWEDVLAEIGSEDLDRFYSLCRRFNG